LKLPYLRASYTKSVGPIKFCIEIYLPRLLFFKTLRRLGAIFETPCILLCIKEDMNMNISRELFFTICIYDEKKQYRVRGIFIFGGGNKRLRNVTKMYCQCQISHKRRKKECLGKFKFSLNWLKKEILRKPIFVSASKGKVILI
jgi:hypothetical protein